MKQVSLVPNWLWWTLAFAVGAVLVWGVSGFPNYWGFAFWKSTGPVLITVKEREHVRSIIVEAITDALVSDGVHRPSVEEWEVLCEGLAVVNGDVNALEGQVDGDRLGWLAGGMAEIFGNVDALVEEKGLPPYTPAMFCEDMERSPGEMGGS